MGRHGPQGGGSITESRKMKLTDLLAQLKKLGGQSFSTNDVMALLDIEKSNASKALCQLERSGHVMRIKRGLWIFPDNVELSALPAFLVAPFPCYISLHSALFHHGMISQIPESVYVMSPARTRVFKTRAGTVSVHHVAQSFFFGYEPIGQGTIQMATPEKALIDFLYMCPARSRLFTALPELELPRRFNRSKARGIIDLIKDEKRKALVRTRFQELLTTV